MSILATTLPTDTASPAWKISPRLRPFIGGAVLVIPFVVAFGMLLYIGGMPGVIPVGDSGILELAVRSAARGEQLIGSYSRFGFHHPGPLYFYIQALTRTLFGGETLALHLTAIGLNATAATGVAWVLWRSLRGPLFWYGITLTSLYCMFLGQFLVEYWDPAVTILPFIFLLLSCAAAIKGDTRLLGPAALAATFVTQTQLTYVPTVFAIVAVTGVCRTRPIRRLLALPDSTTPITLQFVGWWAIVLAVLWTPTILDQFFDSGNLANIFSAFVGQSPPATRPFRDDYAELCLATTRFLAMPLALGPDVDAKLTVVGSHITLLAQIAVLAVGGIGFGRRRPWIRGLSVLGLTCMAAFLFSIHSIRGEFHFHITLWMSCVGLITSLIAILVIAAILEDGSARRYRFAGIALAWIICGFLVYRNSESSVYHTVIARWQYGTAPSARLIRDSRDTIVRALEPDRGRPIAVRVEPNGVWYGASGLVLLLTREGFDARAVGPHEVRFPMRYRLTDADPPAVEVLLVVDERDMGPGYSLLGKRGVMRVYRRSH